MQVAERYLIARKTAKDRLNLSHQITQADLAEMLGVNRLSVINIEKGATKDPRDSTHKKACKVLRVNFAWLKEGDGAMDPELPNYEIPKIDRIEIKPSTRALDGIDGRYSYTPVVIVNFSDDNKNWECIFPDIEPGTVISTNLASVLDLETLRVEPIFYADIFLMQAKEDQPQTAYILKAYL